MTTLDQAIEQMKELIAINPTRTPSLQAILTAMEQAKLKVDGFDSFMTVLGEMAPHRNAESPHIEALLDKVKQVATLTARLASAEKVVDDAGKMLMRCKSDIFQTARANQMNLTGVDLINLNDTPITEVVGKHMIHQDGIDESLALHGDITGTLIALAEHRKGGSI